MTVSNSRCRPFPTAVARVARHVIFKLSFAMFITRVCCPTALIILEIPEAIRPPVAYRENVPLNSVHSRRSRGGLFIHSRVKLRRPGTCVALVNDKLCFAMPPAPFQAGQDRCGRIQQFVRSKVRHVREFGSGLPQWRPSVGTFGPKPPVDRGILEGNESAGRGKQ